MNTIEILALVFGWIVLGIVIGMLLGAMIVLRDKDNPGGDE